MSSISDMVGKGNTLYELGIASSIARHNFRGAKVGQGPFSIWQNPAATAGRLEEINLYVFNLHNDIIHHPNPASQAFKDAWGNFYRVWLNWYLVARRHPDALQTDEVANKMEEFATQAQQWRASFQAQGGHPTGPDVPVPAKNGGAFPWKVVVYGGLAVAGIFGLAALLKSVPKSAPREEEYQGHYVSEAGAAEAKRTATGVTVERMRAEREAA